MATSDKKAFVLSTDAEDWLYTETIVLLIRDGRFLSSYDFLSVIATDSLGIALDIFRFTLQDIAVIFGKII